MNPKASCGDGAGPVRAPTPGSACVRRRTTTDTRAGHTEERDDGSGAAVRTARIAVSPREANGRVCASHGAFRYLVRTQETSLALSGHVTWIYRRWHRGGSVQRALGPFGTPKTPGLLTRWLTRRRPGPAPPLASRLLSPIAPQSHSQPQLTVRTVVVDSSLHGTLAPPPRHRPWPPSPA